MRLTRFVFVVMLLTALVDLWTPARTQALPQIGTAPVNHVGIVVRDIDETVRQYVRVMGFPVPTVTEFPIDMPDGQKAQAKVTNMYMPNFHIELVQPLNPVGPYYEHLQAYGMGIQHTGFSITGSIDDLRAGMEQKGGRWTLGAKGGVFAYINFRSTLGTSFELVRGAGAPGAPAPAAPSGGALPPLASLPVSHVGFAVKDMDVTAKGYADAFGIPAPRVIDYKDSQFPPDSKWNMSASLRIASWKQGDVGMELIQSVGGPTPWSDYVEKQKGTAAQHIAINVGDRIDETIRDLQMKGGKWINGKAGGGYAYLDFMDTLGIIFELNGTSKSAVAAK